ncbi:arginine--tRNA ligase [Piscirickettsia litoralis]|uniref:Arginine--tRNA ligase n=1 Tax=Piscirickettsia litoralis TaxID=1891921 RepID=A0ABX3A1P4_9GAMM|nr:arginine--tRNA ligase [Piscirickettsia litoralis]ODN42781.1 arginine--tRNA ligase [Piscirickettsia litoralis]
MKQHISHLVGEAVKALQAKDVLPEDLSVQLHIDRTKDKSHGDWATNVALMLARVAGCAPRQLAEKIVASLPASEHVSKVEIAGPGFINFFLNAKAQSDVVTQIFAQKEAYGRSEAMADKKVILEFVSANPTGPLHVGHGRWAAMGAVVGNLLEAVGAKVHREYYVNDGGRQMDILATSTWLRYLELGGEKFEFPLNGYRGDYIFDIAKQLHSDHQNLFMRNIADIYDVVCENSEENKEQHIDGLIQQAKARLGDDYKWVFKAALESVLGDIKEDLAEFGVNFDCWFSEKSLVDDGAVEKALNRLKEGGYTYEKEGAIWFKSTEFADDKDRVLVRNNGQQTYFTPDIAYHMDKLDRGHNLVIDLFGADHHGYVARMRAAMQALGAKPDDYHVLLGQFVSLYRGGEQVQMSTRSGSFVTLRELRDEVGNDAARFFYVMRKFEQPLDFDLDLAKSKSNDNPVYYIQYAHARICSVLRQMADKNVELNTELGLASLERLVETQEIDLLKRLAMYPELLQNAALNHEPHVLANYLRDLANGLHTYYNAHQFLVEDAVLCQARLCLVLAVKQVLANGLELLGISAPQAM